MRALGVLVRLLSRPDHWRTNSEGLAAEFGCGRDAVRGAMNELRAAGYVAIRKVQDKGGRWSTAWVVFDEPQEVATEDGNSGAGETDAWKTDAGLPDAGKPGAIERTDVARNDEVRVGEGPNGTPAAGSPEPASRPTARKERSASAIAFDAYADAYRSRYGADPVRNAKVNGQMARLVERIGADEAGAVAVFYVGLSDPYYVREMHTVDALLKDAEKLRTRWATGRLSCPVVGGAGRPLADPVDEMARREAETLKAMQMLGIGGGRSDDIEVEFVVAA